MDDEGVMLRWHKGVYKGWVLAERCPLIRPAGTSRRLDATLGEGRFFWGLVLQICRAYDAGAGCWRTVTRRRRDFKLEISNLKDGQKWESEQQRFNRGLRG